MMAICRGAVATIALCALVVTATRLRGQGAELLPGPPGRVEEVESGALAVAPELGTDLLLHLAAQASLPASARERLALDALDLGASVPTPLPRTRAFSGPTDSLASYQARADALGLDRLSIRLKAVSLLLPLDRSAALQKLADLGYPKLAPESCRDAFAYDFTLWYATIAKAAAGFQRDDDRIAFLSPYLRSVTSPAQLAPAAKLISAEPTRLRPVLAQEFASAIANLPTDARLAAESAPAGAHALLTLASACPLAAAACTAPLANYRDYLTRALQAGLCSDSRGAKYEFQTLAKLNPLFRQRGLAPLDLASSQIRTAELAQNASDLWADPQARALLNAWRRLRDQAAQSDYDPGAVAAYEQRASSWSEPGAPPETVFLVRVLSLLAPLGATRGALRSDCIQRMVALLDASPMRHDHPRIWLVVFYLVAGEASGPGTRAAFAVALANSSSQELRLYRLVLDVKP